MDEQDEHLAKILGLDPADLAPSRLGEVQPPHPKTPRYAAPLAGMMVAVAVTAVILAGWWRVSPLGELSSQPDVAATASPHDLTATPEAGRQPGMTSWAAAALDAPTKSPSPLSRESAAASHKPAVMARAARHMGHADHAYRIARASPRQSGYSGTPGRLKTASMLADPRLVGRLEHPVLVAEDRLDAIDAIRLLRQQ